MHPYKLRNQLDNATQRICQVIGQGNVVSKAIGKAKQRKWQAIRPTLYAMQDATQFKSQVTMLNKAISKISAINNAICKST